MRSVEIYNTIEILGVRIRKGTFINCLTYRDHWLLRYDTLLDGRILISKIGSICIDRGYLTRHEYNRNGVLSIRDIDAVEIMSKGQIKQ